MINGRGGVGEVDVLRDAHIALPGSLFYMQFKELNGVLQHARDVISSTVKLWDAVVSGLLE